MDERLQFVARHLAGEAMSDLCREFGISRKTGYKIFDPALGGLSKKLHAKAAAEKQQSITLVNQSFDERKIVVLRSDASDKTAKQNESDDQFRLADDSTRIAAPMRVAYWES